MAKITVLGSGLIGVCSAYYLQKKGHEVTVIDRQKKSAMEASFANGGQISACYSEPWSSISNLKKIVTWLGKEDSPILFRNTFESKQYIWGLNFLKECMPSRNRENIKSMLDLSLLSRREIIYLRQELGLQYPHNSNGILTFYTSSDSYAHGIESAKFMSQFGCNRIVKTREATLSLEPALQNTKLTIYGADYSEDDESGDAHIFTNELTKICKKIGVKFLFNKNISGHSKNGDKHIIEFQDTKTTQSNYVEAKKIVVCMGAYSYEFLKKLGINTLIYPAKGYSITIPITDSDLVNNISLTDMDYKIVLTRIGDYLRVAGTAEFNGYDLSINPNRINALVERTKLIIPNGLNYDKVKPWAGLRPSTPGNVPLIGETKIKNLFINAGHGTLGWTMACGSGKRIQQIIDRQE